MNTLMVQYLPSSRPKRIVGCEDIFDVDELNDEKFGGTVVGYIKLGGSVNNRARAQWG